MGMQTDEPFHTTVDRSAENSVEIWSASKCRISANPRTLSYQLTHSSSRPSSTFPTTWSMALKPAGRPRANLGSPSVVNPGPKHPS